MNGAYVKKPLSLAIFLLFLSVSVIPSTGTTDVKQIAIPASSGNTLYVGGSGEGNYTKIQDAIDNASDGDTVFVYDDSSPYYENLEVDKSINLIGENKESTIIDGNENGNVINISISKVSIERFTIQDGLIGICIIGSNRQSISNNIIKDNVKGIKISSSFSFVTENLVENNTIGIDIHNTEFIRVKSNNIVNNKEYGVFIQNSRFTIVNKNNIQDNGISIFYDYITTYFPYPVEFSLWYTLLESSTLRFKSNYYEPNRVMPHTIDGHIYIYPIFNWGPDYNYDVKKFDWRPAQEPYDIGV